MSVAGPEMTSPSVTATQALHLGALTIRSERDGAAHVLTLAGELDLAGARNVEEELRCIEGTTAVLTSIFIDLRGLTFIDSTGLRLLAEANHRADAATYRLVLLQPRDRAFRVCQVAGIDALLPFEPAPAEADG